LGIRSRVKTHTHTHTHTNGHYWRHYHLRCASAWWNWCNVYGCSWIQFTAVGYSVGSRRGCITQSVCGTRRLNANTDDAREGGGRLWPGRDDHWWGNACSPRQRRACWTLRIHRPLVSPYTADQCPAPANCQWSTTEPVTTGQWQMTRRSQAMST